jgi:hypothetical protein
MRKTLLVGGDSFSDQRCNSYDGTDVVTWPILLAEKLDMDLVCLAQSGAGNEQIYSSIQDYVCKNNPENIGMVIAAWSKSERMDYELVMHHSSRNLPRSWHRSWHNTRVSPRGELYHFIRKSIRNFYNLQMLCETHDLPYKQFQMISLFMDYISEYHSDAYKETRLECIEYINESPQFFHIDKSNFIGWPIYNEAGGFVVGDHTVHQQWREFHKLANNNPNSSFFKSAKDVPQDYVIGPHDGHPNKTGHRLIMEFIYENL